MSYLRLFGNMNIPILGGSYGDEEVLLPIWIFLH
jgi:hypothetical protein